MHLAVIATNYPPHQGGVEAHLAGLSPRLARRGIACTVVCLGDEPGERDDDGVRVLTLRRRVDVSGVLALPTPADWRRVSADLLGSGVTHVATHTRFFPMSGLGVRWARRQGLPSVHTEHGAGFVRTGRGVTDLAARGVDQSMGRRVLRGATEVVAVSRRSAEFVRALSGREVEVVGNGVDLAEWRGSAESGDAVAARPRLVFVGRLAAEKGWAEFLDVVASLRAAVPGLDAVVAGDGPDLQGVRRVVAERGLAEVVQVTGPLPRRALAAALAGSVYVNPSRASEGFQLTQLEALAAGAAVVTYDVGVASELAATGAPVRVVPVGDLGGLVTGARSALVEPWSPASSESLGEWDWDVVADRYAAVLHRVSRL